MLNPMLERWTSRLSTSMAIPVALCGFAVVVAYITSLSSNHNDKAVHRACAYEVGAAGTEAYAQVHALMEQQWHGVSSPQRRLSYCSSYFLPTRATYFLEHHLRLHSAFQSVFIVQLTLHLLMLLLVVAVLWTQHGQKVALQVAWCLAFSLLPWQSIATWLFPFSNAFFSPQSWRTPYPRGAAQLGVFGAFALWTLARDRKQKLLAGIPLLFALAMHHAMAALNAMAIVVGVLAVSRLQLLELPSALFRKRMITLGVSAALLSCVKGAVNIAYLHWGLNLAFAQLWPGLGLRVVVFLSAVFAALYWLSSWGLLALWRSNRDDPESALTKLGDGCARAMIALAFLIAVGYPFAPTAHDWDSSIGVLFYEPPRRILGAAHLTFFVLAGIVITRKLAIHALAICRTVFAMHGFVACATEVYRSFDVPELTATPRWTTYVVDPHALEVRLPEFAGHEMGQYSDYWIYQAVANEYRAREK